ncbi:hypothetical protein [Clostridium beijerinckii]|uniref:hypothetical protein n=1 Tax=Clostridium beijerinckii TaxID=1520 RepID=UPI0011157F77|nr:hypothetical protein [Clostridium beijerinckii]MBA8937743.1 hypothetical protein [Clostridium beijerinckii]NRU41641.1 hypothetical protein [Clostridium beijerinckii]NSB00815.1 hypothetical protein [Clostridium beijerinckii]
MVESFFCIYSDEVDTFFVKDELCFLEEMSNIERPTSKKSFPSKLISAVVLFFESEVESEVIKTNKSSGSI